MAATNIAVGRYYRRRYYTPVFVKVVTIDADRAWVHRVDRNGTVQSAARMFVTLKELSDHNYWKKAGIRAVRAQAKHLTAQRRAAGRRLAYMNRKVNGWCVRQGCGNRAGDTVECDACKARPKRAR